MSGGELMIKFDLHIHSIASEYKEDDNIVSQSTPENAEVLLDKLNHYNVSLFSITDHNRFNVELYTKIDEIMTSDNYRYTNVKGLVAGVEFDVRIDPNMKKCHIISIFDTKNKVENYNKIRDAIEQNKLTDPQSFYEKEDFESILKSIGLNVILIACQRSSLSNSSGKHNSLSESSSEPMEMISSGYISALEFQKPNVEGIIKNNLKEADIDSSLVMGSDCHEWSAYPMHDNSIKPITFHHSCAKILPTFKGLLMAFTSPKTRFNIGDNLNPHYIKNLSINGQTIPLANGINVIIGENGSGKSSLLTILNDDTKQSYISKIKKDNDISIQAVDGKHIRYIGQGEIVAKFSDNTLFKDDYYENVDTGEFQSFYGKFKNELYEYINSNIDTNNSIGSLKEMKLEYFEDKGKNYFINVKQFARKKNISNEHKKKRSDITEIINRVENITKDKYFKPYARELFAILENLIIIEKDILNKSNNAERLIFVKNNIISATNTYKDKVKEASSAYDNINIANNEKRHKFIESIVEAMYKKSHPKEFPAKPPKLKGQSTKTDGGFSFNCEALYNDKDVIDDFFSKMFNKDYRSRDALSKISTNNEFKDAIRQCTNIDMINELYNKNYSSFEEEMISCKRYIVDGTKTNLGNTLGEMSLAYFKFTMQNDNRDIYLIDQPEDHISNLNITRKLITYFNAIRNEKQLIIVSHNPLLVVNQDVDNVIFISKTNDKIEAKYGSLEYEDDNYSILDLIAEHMDGGTDSIKKRLKVYE